MRRRFTDPDHFQEVLNGVLYPSRAISNAQHLKGRRRECSDLKRTLLTSGRQAFVYGLRGAGKTSLALTVAAEFAQSENVTVLCSPQMSFGDVMRNAISSALRQDPLEAGYSVTTEGHGKVGLGLLSAGGKTSSTQNYAVPTPSDPNEAAALVASVVQRRGGRRFCFVIDEFDQMHSEEAHLQFGLLAKAIADGNVPAKFIFCGVADDLQQIFKAHPSTLRLFEPIEVNRLGLQPCLDIVADVERALEIEVEWNTKVRIAQISDGFPYFVHLITERVVWRWFEDMDGSEGRTSPAQYEAGLRDASQSAAPELKQCYEMAANKYALDGEMIIWALATGDVLDKQVKLIHKDFSELYNQYGDAIGAKRCLTQNQISPRLSFFTKDQYGGLMRSPRRSYYTFSEKRMRGYARLRAALRGVSLRPDHPLASRLVGQQAESPK